MIDQPQPIPRGFAPVPAVPIVVLAHHKGQCLLKVGGGVAAGLTLRDALARAAALSEKEGRNG